MPFTPEPHLPVMANQEESILKALPEAAPARPKRPRELLVVALNVRDGKKVHGHASIPVANRALELMGEKTGAYRTTFSNDPRAFRPREIKNFDAVCFNNTGGVLFEDRKLRESLANFVKGGGGLVGFHAAAATFCQYPVYDQWPEFGEMLGAYENGGHPWGPNETITIKVDDPAHPVNAAFGGESFEISDEVFQFQDPYSRSRLRVLLSIDTSRTDMSASRHFLASRLQDMDFAMSWIHMHEEGRVFYTSFGHNAHLFWNESLLAHFLAGIQFALGDLEVDASPSSGS